MTWWRRDPDMGRDRHTKALGRRDWSWFVTYDDSTAAPVDVEAATPSWAGHAFTKQDRHDRTLGIPPRNLSMWSQDPSALPGDSEGEGDERRLVTPAVRVGVIGLWR